MYNQHQAALLELQQNNMQTQIDLKALSQPTDQVCSIQACIFSAHLGSYSLQLCLDGELCIMVCSCMKLPGLVRLSCTHS